MSVFRRPGRKVWWFEFEYRGRRYRESAGTRSKTLAIDIEPNRRREVEEAANGIRRNRDAAILFSVAAKEWLQLKKPGWAPKTHIIAKTDVEHLKAHFGKLLLVDITDHESHGTRTKRRDAKACKQDDQQRSRDASRDPAALSPLGAHRARTFACCPLAMMSAARYPSRRKRDCWPRVPRAVRGPSCRRSLGAEHWTALRRASPAHLAADRPGQRAVTVGQSKTAHGAGRSVPLNVRALKALTAWAQEFPDRKPYTTCSRQRRWASLATTGSPSVFDTNPGKPIGSWKVAWTTARLHAA